eukprot:360624-Pleurochrysis_carterae.AAC.1
MPASPRPFSLPIHVQAPVLSGDVSHALLPKSQVQRLSRVFNLYDEQRLGFISSGAVEHFLTEVVGVDSKDAAEAAHMRMMVAQLQRESRSEATTFDGCDGGGVRGGLGGGGLGGGGGGGGCGGGSGGDGDGGGGGGGAAGGGGSGGDGDGGGCGGRGGGAGDGGGDNGMSDGRQTSAAAGGGGEEIGISLDAFLRFMWQKPYLGSDARRRWVAISLQEAESLRGSMHYCCDSNTALVRHGSVAVGLRFGEELVDSVGTGGGDGGGAGDVDDGDRGAGGGGGGGVCGGGGAGACGGGGVLVGGAVTSFPPPLRLQLQSAVQAFRFIDSQQ